MEVALARTLLRQSFVAKTGAPLLAYYLTQSSAVCIMLFLTSVSLSQEPVRKQDQASEIRTDDKDASRVGAHMRRVQASFDENNDAVWFRMAFVATVTEIRSLKETDKLLGSPSGAETEVAVLCIKAVGLSDHATIKEGKIIVCPVGKLRDLWFRWREEKTEILFEYNRVGKRESVQKFGC